MYRTEYNELKNKPYLFEHKPRGWLIGLDYKVPQGKMKEQGYYTLEVNGIAFTDMDEAPPRERAALARTAIQLSMTGQKK